MKLIFCITGSFCTHRKALLQLEALSKKHEVVPVLSEMSAMTDTRFGKAGDLIQKVTALTGHEPVFTIKDAEETVAGGGFDAAIVCPCTGNTLAKIASGITDTVVTMAVKGMLRNRKPVVLAVASNDGLAGNLFNLACAMEKKCVYLVPLGQDDAANKPTSLVCDFTKVGETLEAAVNGVQIQPVLTE